MPYERPAFAPDRGRDPDLTMAAARYAAEGRIARVDQDAFAIQSHARALAARERMVAEIVPLNGVQHDRYARNLSAQQAARVPLAATWECPGPDFDPRTTAVSRLSISPKADGAAFVLLGNRKMASSLGIAPKLQWRGSKATGGQPEMPMLAATRAAQALLARHDLSPSALWGVELHDAFAVQALSFAKAMELRPDRMNRAGGGLARGHPIGASGAISLVRLVADMAHEAPVSAIGLVAIAAAGGLGSAALIERI